jgi:amino acid transporter
MRSFERPLCRKLRVLLEWPELAVTGIAEHALFVQQRRVKAPEDSRIGTWMTSAFVVGAMIGAGIFMLPVALAPLGVNALIGWMLSSVGALTIAFALGRLSQLGGDGIQANIERQMGRNVAFLAAWSFWVSNWAAQAGVAIAGASALSLSGRVTHLGV